MKIIDTKRLRLEPITVEHAAAYFHIATNPALYTFIPRDPPASLEQLANRYNSIKAGVSPDGTEIWLNWFLKFKTSPASYIGKLEATILPDQSASIAYEIDPAFQKQGYATEACQAMFDELRHAHHVKTIKAWVDTRNERSFRLLERLGFIRIDNIKDADFFKGQTSDEYVYELK